MRSPHRVLLLSPGGKHDPTARSASGLQFHACADLADLLGRAAAGAADAAVVSPRAAGLDAVVVARLRGLGCRTLALVQGPEDVALARRIGLTESVGQPLDARALLAALLAEQEHPSPAAGDGASRGSIVAVWGPPGAGRTTVAALLAVGASRSGQDVVVVDADLACPQWSMMASGGAVSSGLIIASRRIAAGVHDLSDLLIDAGAGVKVLSVAAEPHRWVEVAPTMMGGLLQAVAALADVVVVDVGADIREAHPAYDIGWAHDSGAMARHALSAADTVVGVFSADPVGVHRFAAWWPVLGDRAAPDLIVANRVGVPRGGKRPQAQIASVLHALGAAGDPFHIPWDTRAADALLEPSWPAARGWRNTPERLWTAMMEQRAPAAAGA